MKAVYAEQLSLFAQENGIAVSIFDGQQVEAKRPEGWMLDLAPKSEYMVMVGSHPLLLRPVPKTRAEIEEGHEFYHYEIGGQMYAGIFVGRETVG